MTHCPFCNFISVRRQYSLCLDPFDLWILNNLCKVSIWNGNFSTFQSKNVKSNDSVQYIKSLFESKCCWESQTWWGQSILLEKLKSWNKLKWPRKIRLRACSFCITLQKYNHFSESCWSSYKLIFVICSRNTFYPKMNQIVFIRSDNVDKSMNSRIETTCTLKCMLPIKKVYIFLGIFREAWNFIGCNRTSQSYTDIVQQ